MNRDLSVRCDPMILKIRMRVLKLCPRNSKLPFCSPSNSSSSNNFSNSSNIISFSKSSSNSNNSNNSMNRSSSIIHLEETTAMRINRKQRMDTTPSGREKDKRMATSSEMGMMASTKKNKKRRGWCGFSHKKADQDRLMRSSYENFWQRSRISNAT